MELLSFKQYVSTVRKVLFLFFVAFAAFVVPGLASAQTPGGQDSTGTGVPALRPRRDTYIIVPFPSPATHGQTMKIQIYNHDAQELSVQIVDLNGNTIAMLQPQQMLPNGIHSYDFPTASVSTGTYYIKLVTYSSTGSQNLIQNSRFIVLH